MCKSRNDLGVEGENIIHSGKTGRPQALLMATDMAVAPSHSATLQSVTSVMNHFHKSHTAALGHCKGFFPSTLQYIFPFFNL